MMVHTIKSFVRKRPKLHRLVYKLRNLQHLRYRCVPIHHNTISQDVLAKVRDDSSYNNVVDDLISYTEFSEDKLEPYLSREPYKHFESEFNWFTPKDEKELRWFYRCSSAYLFANSIHPYAVELDVIKNGKVLDYGAGIGCNTLGLAKRGLDVDFLEISRIQADFIHFRAGRHQLNNIKEVRPYNNGKFDPVYSVKEKYDAIIAMDVLEHIPDYHLVVHHFIDRLNPGGLIVENSPFEPAAKDIAIHVAPSIPLVEAMKGMDNISTGVWRKKQWTESSKPAN